MIFVINNTEKIAYDPIKDMWFKNHPYAEKTIFAPVKWLKQKWYRHE